MRDAFWDTVTRGLLISLLSVVFSGMFLGGQIGIAAVAQVWQRDMANCTEFHTEAACASATPILSAGSRGSNARCLWHDASCGFADSVNCSKYNDEGRSLSSAFDDGLHDPVDAQCIQKDGWYVHRAGWSPAEIGLFSSLISVTGFVSSPLAYFIIRRFGRIWLVVATGTVSLVAALAMHVGFMLDSLPAILASRVIAGMATVFICISGPTLVGAVCPRQHRRSVVAQFQIFTTVGIVGMAAAGYGVQVTTDVATATDLAWRLQGLLAFNTVFALLLLLTGIGGKCLLPFEETEEEPDEDVSAGDPEAENSHDDGIRQDLENTPLLGDSASGSQQVQHPPDHTSRLKSSSSASQIAVAVALPACQQLGGINAMVTYAPIIAATIGVNPLQGNFILMAFNCLASIVAMPINRRSGFRSAFLVGVAGCAASDVLLAIMLSPGVVDSTVQRVCCAIFSITFITSFELGIGIPYYPLTTRAMDRPHRDKGIALALVVEGVLSFATNLAYPIVASSRDDSLGQALAFYFFAAVSLGGFVVLFRHMRHTTEYG